MAEPSEARKRVLRRKILSRLRDMGRYRPALQEAQAEFGDFDLEEFTKASSSNDPGPLNRVAAVERHVDLLYNYMIEVAAFALELADERNEDEKPNAPRDLRRLERSGALTKAQRSA
jgi:hypothetical protein